MPVIFCSISEIFFEKSVEKYLNTEEVFQGVFKGTFEKKKSEIKIIRSDSMEDFLE